jgi:hypothetical protein
MTPLQPDNVSCSFAQAARIVESILQERGPHSAINRLTSYRTPNAFAILSKVSELDRVTHAILVAALRDQSKCGQESACDLLNKLRDQKSPRKKVIAEPNDTAFSQFPSQPCTKVWKPHQRHFHKRSFPSDKTRP